MSNATDRLMSSLRMRLPGALDGVIQHELFAALDEFLKNSNAWQEAITLTSIADEPEYEIESEDNRAQIVRLLWVKDTGAFPVNAILPEPDRMVFDTTPTLAADYTVQVALSLIDPVNTDGFPDAPEFIFQLYHDELLDGVLGRMMSQPAKPYTSERYAIYHMRRFRQGMARARVATNHSNISEGQRWRFPAFA